MAKAVKAEEIQSPEELAELGLRRKDELKKISDALSGSSRRKRQTSAAAFSIIAKANPERAALHVDALIDALERPEAQTRWECLDALTEVVSVDTRSCEKAVAGAEQALFDEDNGPVRLAAMRFLCRLGSTTENRSEKVWPLIDEAIQCYHGDLEFQEMLVAVIGFTEGKLSANVRKELKARMSFDASNAKGVLKTRAAQIVSNC